MHKIKTEPQEIWAEYENGRSYKSSINLFDIVKENENFFLGRQWEGINAPSLQKPVFNLPKRVINYFISVLVSDDFTVSINPFLQSALNRLACGVYAKEVDRALEKTDIRSANRDFLRNAAVDRDACYYVRFNPDVEIGQTAKGEIEVELINNTQVFFGNPYTPVVKDQPYIILAFREHVDVLKAKLTEKAKKGEVDLDKIKPDNSDSDNADQLVTVLLKLYMENGTVWYTEATHEATLTKPTDTSYTRYPVVYMSWEKVKHSCHGQSAVEEIIPNQKAVNTLMAAAINHTQNNGFPTIFYDSAKFPKGFPGGSGVTAGVTGNPNDAFASSYRAGDMSSQVMQMVDSIVRLTKDLMGASDAALGNIRPENTSAIVAVQRATAAPLDLQRKEYYRVIEELVRVFVDIMSVRYGVREVSTDSLPEELFEDGKKPDTMSFDFAQLKDIVHEIKVDIGASAYFSELLQLQTLDNLMAKGIITDAITYLEALPDTAVRHKHKLIAELKKQRAAAEMPASVEQVPAMPAAAWQAPAMAMAPVAALGGELDGVL